MLWHMTHGADFDLHLVAYVKQERAWILQSPFDVWDNEVGPRAEVVSLRLHRESQGDWVFSSVEFENAFDLHFGVAPKVDSTGQLGGCEGDLGITLALQNLLVHLMVASLIPGVAAGSIDYDQAAGRAGRWVEVNRSSLESEGSMHRVERSGQGELDPGVGWIEFERHVLCQKRFSA